MRNTNEILEGHTMDVAPVIDVMTSLATTAQAYSSKNDEQSVAIAGLCNEILRELSAVVPAESMLLLAQEAAESMEQNVTYPNPTEPTIIDDSYVES